MRQISRCVSQTVRRWEWWPGLILNLRSGTAATVASMNVMPSGTGPRLVTPTSLGSAIRVSRHAPAQFRRVPSGKRALAQPLGIFGPQRLHIVAAAPGNGTAGAILAV